MKFTRRARQTLLAVSLVGMMGLAACGSDDDGASGATATTAESSATTEAATATSAATGTSMQAGSMTEPFGPACSSVPTSGAGSFEGMAEDPAATAASNNPALSTLVGAVKAAGLVDTLNGPGPFTIFAPANDAFAAIPKATLDTVLADPTGQLTEILTYHVVAGQELGPEELADAGTLKTVNGGEVTIAGSGEDLTVNGANVVCGNVSTANAKVYIIDEVLMPS